MQTTFLIQSHGAGLYEFTENIRRWLAGHGDGLLTLFVLHTSCSLLVQENADPDVQVDLEAWLCRLIPDADDPSHAFLTHVTEGPDDMPAHLKAAILPVSLSIPVANGVPRLGRWQGVYLFEHRAAPHRREVAALFLRL